jgi:lysophospholipase L1-like esterase
MNSSTRERATLLKVVALNLFVFFALIGALLSGVVMLNAALAILAAVRSGDERARTPNYAGIPWAEQHFKEFRSLKTDYYSYIGWRRKPYSGETITVAGPYGERKTAPEGRSDQPLVYFFGGSTMWGTGVDDASTIPSLFARETGVRARNFGESGYTAHQSLEMLLRLLQDGHRPDIVVFYDGVNEVAVKCRGELGSHSTSEEMRFRTRLDAGVGTAGFYLLPIRDLLQWASWELRGQPARGYDCDVNAEKAAAVRSALIHDWQVARTVAESRGIRFVGVLQPVSTFSQTEKTYLPGETMLEKQYLSVYPRLQEMAARHGFASLVGALDIREPVYVDFWHLSPNGNTIIARRLAEILQPMLAQARGAVRP